jgi:hypothetical protein
MYWLHTEQVSAHTIHSVYKEDYNLLHRRFGHPSKGVLRHAKENTTSFPSIDFPVNDPICPGCTKGKMTQRSFPPSSSRSSAPFQRIHSDLKSFPTESYHHYKYFISFVDDYSSFAWLLCLRQKSSAINVL